MRFEKYLKEDFHDSVKIYGKMVDIFVNPSMKELKELDPKYGYRFIIDSKKKKFYVWSAEYTHSTILDEKLIPDFKSHSDYFSRGEGADRFFTGHSDDPSGKFNDIYSDTFYGVHGSSDFGYAAKNHGVEIVNNIRKLKKEDFSFMNKWFDEKKIYKIIDDTIKLVQTKYGSWIDEEK